MDHQCTGCVSFPRVWHALRSHARHDSCKYATWLIDKFDVIHSRVWHDSLTHSLTHSLTRSDTYKDRRSFSGILIINARCVSLSVTSPAYMDESCHIHQYTVCVTSCLEPCTDQNESCHIHEYIDVWCVWIPVIDRNWTCCDRNWTWCDMVCETHRLVCHLCTWCVSIPVKPCHTTHMNEPWHKCEWVMSLTY